MTEVRREKSCRGPNADDCDSNRDAQTILHFEPAFAALRLGLIALATSEANSGAFM